MLDAEMARTIIGAVIGAVVGFLLNLPSQISRSKKQASMQNTQNMQIAAGNGATVKDIKQISKQKIINRPRSAVLAVLVFAFLGITIAWFTGSGGIPNGTYKPVGSNTAHVYDITIKNRIFTMRTPFGISIPLPYSYRDGEFKIYGSFIGLGMPYTYDESTGHIVQELGYLDGKIEWAR